QTGIVMIVYIDHAFRERKARGEMRDLGDIIAAHMEGTVQRVRPKLMTVATMLVGLIPLLWATGSGADVMKRIAAPMVGGLITSAFLTLELIPVISTYWRQEQLLHERLAELDPRRLARLRWCARGAGAGWLAGLAAAVAPVYFVVAPAILIATAALAAAAVVAGTAGYLLARPGARRLVWPEATAPA
ncbi:MAG TPA: efflux RND transporter permease subunit, partial [Haliangiales bacterium]|nr:efflux RND transporter permease subunit [Haliangiales bacterium]